MSSFSFETMLIAFENVKFPIEGAAALPETESFALAMAEVAQLFDHLGTGFGFIRKDIETKVAVVNEKTAGDERDQSLQVFVERELAAKKARSKKPPSVARTVLRLMWAARFLCILMSNIGEAVLPDSKKSLGDCVRIAYDTALRENHNFLVRQAASAAMLLLPDIDTFLEKLNVDKSRRTEYLTRIDKSLGPLVEKMYAYYGEKQIMDLP